MLTTLAAEERKTGWGLRIEAIGSCCSKKTYNLEFEEKPREGDIILDTEFPVYIAPESHDAFKGATLDYIQSTRGSGFKIDKPRTKQGCGCGSGGGCS
jgi:iron-sulfur cluster assembly accessory protein